jgi:hypothetical protein
VPRQAERCLSYQKGSVFTRAGALAKVPAMTNLLTFLGGIFYLGMAIIIAVAIVEHWRTTRRQTTEQVPAKQVEKAA